MKTCKKCGDEYNKTRCTNCYRITKDASRFKTTFNHIVKMRNEKECQLCTLPFKDNRDQHIDHCHTSGFIRGVLCRSCNVMLGYAKDNPQRLLNAIKYLEEFYGWPSVLKEN